MSILQALLMGIVQGVSEFLPISSSAHLVFTSNFYKVMQGQAIILEPHGEEIFLDIMLHLGTLVAVIIFFRKDIAEIASKLFLALRTWNFEDKDAKLGLYIVAGTIVTVVLALPLDDFAQHLVYNPVLVSGLLILTGLILFFSEYLSQKREIKHDELTWKQALLVGVAQGLAVLPGFSRSGWTIAAGLFSGLKRETAAKYSFLLSIPIILGASMVYPLVKIDLKDAISSYNWSAIIFGTLVSAIAGYICIKYFMKFIAKFSLNIFGFYCIIVGVLTMLFFIKFS